MNQSIEKMICSAELFTRAHQDNEQAHPAMREAACLRALFPDVLDDIRESDGYAGRIGGILAGYRYSFSTYDTGYFLDDIAAEKMLDSGSLSELQRAAVLRLREYWKANSTFGKHVRADGVISPENIKNALLPLDPRFDWRYEVFAGAYMSRMCEIDLDFDKLLTLGLPGLRNEADECLKEMSGGDAELFRGMEAALDVVADCCIYYAEMAEGMANNAREPRKAELLEMARILRKLTVQRPETLREAIQLYWLYGAMAFVDNYGRMDVYLGDFYTRDIDSGRLTPEQAQGEIEALWRMIDDVFPSSGRVIVGGMGRRNPANADRFALAAMEASRAVRGDSPTLSLRMYTGMNPDLFDKAVTVIGEGGTFPILYNDDVHVPALAKAFDVPIRDAEQYVMNNCGEYTLEHRSVNSPNGSISYYKILELTLFDGVDPITGRPMGLKTGGLEAFETFGELVDAFKKHATFFIGLIAEHMMTLIDVTAKDSPNLLCSMLFDDCMAKGLGLLRGARVVGLDIETHGVISVANSLLAVKKLVYDEKAISRDNLLEILKANFEGFERERRMLLDAPKFGNDDPGADSLALDIFQYINTTTMETGKSLGAGVSLASHVSVNGNVYLGLGAIASPDGRLRGQPVTNSINPLPGQDKNGVTALLNSMAKFQPDPASGLVMHLKLSREMFAKHRNATKALLQSYFKKGGSYLCIAVMDRGDLERAMQEPEAYASLMVRVGGFSARFVTLPREMQQEILSRTLY